MYAGGIEAAYLAERVNNLEQELRQCQSLIWLLLKRIERELPSAQPDELVADLLHAGADDAIDRVMSAVDAEVCNGRTEMALRCLREATGAPWEELYQTVARWRNFDMRQKRNWLRFARMRQQVLHQLRETKPDDPASAAQDYLTIAHPTGIKKLD